jgi:SAM-dependent methyltransferase
MMDFSASMKYVLEVGCASGYYTQYLANRLNGTVIGIDVDKYGLYRAKIKERLRACYEKPASHGTIEFVCCDVNHLPIEKNSIDLVVCVSVLEHVKDLDGAIKGIKDSMRKKGILVAGYPIETDLFRALLRVFLPSGMRIRDSRILGKEQFRRSPETHKQSFATIRRLLQKHFLLVCRKKSFATRLPDLISWYECVKMRKGKA